MKAAYLRDAVAWVQWIAWLEKKMKRGTDPGFTEWHAAEHLTALRAEQPLFAGLAYENISATGANAGKQAHARVLLLRVEMLTRCVQHYLIIRPASILQQSLRRKMSI